MTLSGSPFLGLSGEKGDSQEPPEVLLKAKKRRLLVLQKQEKVFSGAPPRYIIHAIEGLKEEIKSLEEKLNG